MLAKRQGELLAAAWALVKPGGRLLYTSCSFLAAENEKVVVGFLQRTSGCQGPDSRADDRLAGPAGRVGPGLSGAPGGGRHGRVLLCLPE